MNGLINAYLFFNFLFCSYAYYQLYDFDSNQANMILSEHNRLRAQEPASNMQALVWDWNLALIAKDWASRCAAMHRPGVERTNRAGYNVIGENIWWSSETYLRSDLAAIIRDFYDEKPFFSFGSNWCQPGQMCGHYTQVVWANSCAVGCAAAYCEDIYLGRGIRTGHMIVCNYGPAGNYVNQLPYTYGTQCASCPGTCQNGLCPSSCAGPPVQAAPAPAVPPPAPVAPPPPPPVAPPPPPVAPPPPPVAPPPPPVAPPPPPVAPPPPPVAPPPPPVAPPPPPVPAPQPAPPPPASVIPQKPSQTEITSVGCNDQHPNCPSWTSQGECQKNSVFMSTYCKSSCKVSCTEPSPPVAQSTNCFDRENLCPFWSSLGECNSNAAWMDNNCYNSCHKTECTNNLAVAKSSCVDLAWQCNFWASLGECGTNAFYMRWKCPKSCKLC